jgi:hypothetical protein
MLRVARRSVASAACALRVFCLSVDELDSDVLWNTLTLRDERSFASTVTGRLLGAMIVITV